MTVDMVDARQKLELAMKAAHEVIGQFNHMTATPESRNINDSDATKLLTGVMTDLEEFNSEWLHAKQAVGNSRTAAVKARSPAREMKWLP